MKRPLSIALAAFSFILPALAAGGPREDLLARYAAEAQRSGAGFSGFSSERGQAFTPAVSAAASPIPRPARRVTDLIRGAPDKRLPVSRSTRSPFRPHRRAIPISQSDASDRARDSRRMGRQTDRATPDCTGRRCRDDRAQTVPSEALGWYLGDIYGRLKAAGI